MPKLQRLLLGSDDEELLKSATSAVKSMVEHDADQVFAWQDSDGKGGLEVILIVIDRLLSPSVDDNAAAEVGGLAAEVVEKAGSERLGPYLVQLLQAVAIRLSNASSAQFIQSLIIVFARLSLISAHEVVDFLAQLQIGNDNGLQVVMTKWLENSVNFAGYDEIRQKFVHSHTGHVIDLTDIYNSVIALSKLYDLSDPRMSQVQVKGDLIVPRSDRIMTRSRARQNPDQYTIIPASLKIVKILADELLSASGTAQAMDARDAAELDDDNSDDEEWEDEPNAFLDLGLGTTKEQLMAYGEGTGNSSFSRGRDDETQAYLLGWFREAAGRPGFADVFNSLSPTEQEKLREMS